MGNIFSAQWWALASSRPVVVKALIIAAIVGTLLALINQVIDMPTWLRVALTYCVPYCVSTVSAVAALWPK